MFSLAYCRSLMSHANDAQPRPASRTPGATILTYPDRSKPTAESRSNK